MYQLLPQEYIKRWKLESIQKEYLQEIRIRSGKTLYLTYCGQEVEQKHVIVSASEVMQIFTWLCGYGVYAYQEEIAKGYITIQGGHRVGIAGQVLTDEYGNVKSMKYISSILIRVSHDIKGAAEKTLPELYENGMICDTLLLSSPGCGKTTFLRDLVRMVSDGNAYGAGQNVSVIDEREELSAMCEGIPMLDVGVRTDVICGCTKAEGMERCLRALAPKVVAVDEIYNKQDLKAVRRLHGSGCVILATHHADSLATFLEKPFGKKVQKEQLFSRIVVLTKENKQYGVKEIYKIGDADA